MGSVYRRGVNYWIDYRCDGKRNRESVGPSKDEAKMRLKDIDVRIAKGETDLAPEMISFQRFLEKYFDHSRANCAPNTVRRYKAVADHFTRFLEAETNCRNLTDISEGP